MKFRKLILLILLTLLLLLLDSSIVPRIYDGRCFVPMTAMLIILIGMEAGAVPGLLFGLLSGLLTDIACGTLGFMTLFYGVNGLMNGVLLHPYRGMRVPSSRRMLMRQTRSRALCVSAFYLIGEAVFYIFQYANSGVWLMHKLTYILIRTAICTICVLLLRPFAAKLLSVSAAKRTPSSEKEALKF